MKRILSGILALGTMAVLFGSTPAHADERTGERQASYDGNYGRYRGYRERQERRERERRRYLMFRARHRYDFERW